MTKAYEKNMSNAKIVSVISHRQRLVKLMTYLIFAAFLGIILGPFISFVVWERNFVFGIIILLLTVACVLICIFIGKPIRKLDAEIKELTGQYIVKGILAEKIEIKKYFPNKYMNTNFLKKCAILPTYNVSHGSDYILGNYKGREFTFCDLLLETEVTDSAGHRESITTEFQGQLITMELGKNIEGFVRIREKKNPRKGNGFLANMLGNSIATENVAFNNQFEVKTSNDQLAFYILTPQFMEAVMRLDELADGYTNIEFRDSSVVITLNTGRDSFELKKILRSKRRLEKYRQSFRRELEIILGVLDEILTKDNLFETD